ncbi:MAG: hypothetical protein WCP28_15550 [Actinomycetes bacterium]
MITAVVLGTVATIIALLGLFGRESTKSPRPSQIVVYALPLGIVAAGYSASVGINLLWTLVAGLSVFLAVLAGGLLGRLPVPSDQDTKPVAAGLSLGLTGLISLGLAAVALNWSGLLISSFTYLQSNVVSLVLLFAAVCFAIGGRSSVGMSRAVVVLLIIGAVAMFGIGFLGGDSSGLTAPQVPVPSPSPVVAIFYAIGVILVGAGYPVLRQAGVRNKARVWTAAAVLTAIVVVTLIGILILYGGSFQLPSLVINVPPVYAPPSVAAILCGLVAIISTVTMGAALAAASHCVAEIRPEWYTDTEDHPVPRRLIVIGLAVIVLLLNLLQLPMTAIMLMLGVAGAGNLIAELVISRGNAKAAGPTADAVPTPAQEAHT